MVKTFKNLENLAEVVKVETVLFLAPVAKKQQKNNIASAYRLQKAASVVRSSTAIQNIRILRILLQFRIHP